MLHTVVLLLVQILICYLKIRNECCNMIINQWSPLLSSFRMKNFMSASMPSETVTQFYFIMRVGLKLEMLTARYMYLKYFNMFQMWCTTVATHFISSWNILEMLGNFMLTSFKNFDQRCKNRLMFQNSLACSSSN